MMLKKRIYLSPPHMEGNEFEYLKKAFDSNWIAPVGPDLKAFERDMSRYVNIPNTLAVASGTAAMHLSLLVEGIGRGDEVLCSSFNFIGSVNPVRYVGAEPVFVDSNEETWNMDPELLREAVIDRKKQGRLPKACIVVHLYGMCADIEPIKEICKENGIVLIEDAAESLGAFYKDKHTGTFGNYGIYSFNGNKIITTSGGGMLAGPNAEKIEEAAFLATQARDDAPYYEHSRIGYNYRLSNLCAALGRGQLRYINKKVEKKREIFENYIKRLKEFDSISFMPELKNSRGNRWLTCIVIDSDEAGTLREEIRLDLERSNIESRPLWKPMHMQPVYRDSIAYTNGVSERLFCKGMCLPSGTDIKDEEIELISGIIKDVLKRDNCFNCKIG